MLYLAEISVASFAPMRALFHELPPITVSYAERERFRAGELRAEWATSYPGIFDKHELRTVINQTGGHFVEWFAAVHLFETTGWLSLIESYQFKVQTWKRSVVKQLGAESLLTFFDTQYHKGFGRKHAPDLLVYAPDFSDFYFCEVKGPRDKLRPVQIEYFKAVSDAAGGKEVVVLPVELV